MLSKDEDFKPPKEHEIWINTQFSNVLDYLSEKDVKFSGAIFIKWLAVPYISLWFARSTEFEGQMIWVMHNLEFTDYILSEDIETPRDALYAFSQKWDDTENDTLRCRDKHPEKLKNHSIMLKSVADDNSFWD